MKPNDLVTTFSKKLKSAVVVPTINSLERQTLVCKQIAKLHDYGAPALKFFIKYLELIACL